MSYEYSMKTYLQRIGKIYSMSMERGRHSNGCWHQDHDTVTYNPACTSLPLRAPHRRTIAQTLSSFTIFCFSLFVLLLYAMLSLYADTLATVATVVRDSQIQCFHTARTGLSRKLLPFPRKFALTYHTRKLHTPYIE